MRDVVGVCGLENLGNTCYLNASVQSMRSVSAMNEYLFENEIHYIIAKNIMIENAKKNGNKIEDDDMIDLISQTITYRYFKLMKLMSSNSGVISPINFKESVNDKMSMFKDLVQNDAHEFMVLLLDKMHDDLKISKNINIFDIIEGDKNCVNYGILSNVENIMRNKMVRTDMTFDDVKDINIRMYCQYYLYNCALLKEKSIIRTLFTGFMYNKKRCENCGNVTMNYEHFNVLEVPLPYNDRDMTLDECYEYISHDERLDGGNMLKCDICNKYTSCISNTYVWDTSDVLIVHLKRFCVGKNMNGNYITVKNNGLVIFDVDDYVPKIYRMGLVKKYSLVSVIYQHGTLNRGHYTACSKNDDEKWWFYDDDECKPIETDDIKSTLNNRDAYILVYKLNKLM